MASSAGQGWLGMLTYYGTEMRDHFLYAMAWAKDCGWESLGPRCWQRSHLQLGSRPGSAGTGDPVLQLGVCWSGQDEGEEPAVSNCRERLVGSWSMCCLWTKGRGHPMSRGSGEDSDPLPAHHQHWAGFSYCNITVIE